MIEIIQKFTKYENLSVSLNEFRNIKIFASIIKEIDSKKMSRKKKKNFRKKSIKLKNEEDKNTETLKIIKNKRINSFIDV
jgi:hypothetical protein